MTILDLVLTNTLNNTNTYISTITNTLNLTREEAVDGLLNLLHSNLVSYDWEGGVWDATPEAVAP